MCESKVFERNYASYRVYAAAVLNKVVTTAMNTKRGTTLKRCVELADRVARLMCEAERKWVEEGKGE